MSPTTRCWGHLSQVDTRPRKFRLGVLLDAVSIPLEANGQTSWLIDAAFPGADTSDFVGRCAAPRLQMHDLPEPCHP